MNKIRTLILITPRFRRMLEIYKIFATDYICDLSDEAAQEMFDYESRGIGDIDITGFNITGKNPNGYAIGKKWLNVTVTSWMGSAMQYGYYPVLKELYADKKFPHWWLDEIFKGFIDEKKKFYETHKIEFDTTYKI